MTFFAKKLIINISFLVFYVSFYMKGDLKMEKGQTGVRFAFYAVAAFVLALLGYSTGLFILTAAVIIAEKNEWATRQIIQACVLFFIGVIFHEVFGWFNIINKIPVDFIVRAWRVLYGVIDRIFYIVMLVFYIIGIVRTAKGKEAKIPLANAIANWACGVVIPKEAPAAAPAETETQSGISLDK